MTLSLLVMPLLMQPSILLAFFVIKFFNISPPSFPITVHIISCQWRWKTEKLRRQVFWFGLGKYQVPTKIALSLPLLSRTGERKYGERLEGRGKDRGRSFTSYCHRENRLNLGRKGSLIHHQSNQSRIVRNKTKS